MYRWDVYFVLALLSSKLQYVEMQGRVLSLGCHAPKSRGDVTVMLLQASEECVLPGKISCKVTASEELTSLRMRGTKSPYNTEAIFPVNTWKERALEMILDNSEVLLAPNTSAYRYLLPRAFETVSGRGFVDVECQTLSAPTPTTSPVDTDTDTLPSETMSNSLSPGNIVLITIAVLVFLAVTIFLAVFLMRRHLSRHQENPAKPKKVKKKWFALTKSRTSTENNNCSTEGNMGIAVYVDPAAPNVYDNKDQSIRDIGNSPSGEYSYTYAAAKNNSGKEPDKNSQKYSYAYSDAASEPKNHVSGKQAKKDTPKYSYAYMDTASTVPHHSSGNDPKSSRENSDVPYEDVDRDAYCYAYGATARPSCNKI